MPHIKNWWIFKTNSDTFVFRRWKKGNNQTPIFNLFSGNLLLLHSNNSFIIVNYFVHIKNNYFSLMATEIINQILPLSVMLFAEDFASITLQFVQNLKGWLNSTLCCFHASKCQALHSSCDHNQGRVHFFLTIRTTDQETQQFTKMHAHIYV